MSDDRESLRGSSVPGKRIDLGRASDQDTDEMPRLQQATDAHRLRDELRKEVERIERGLDHRIRTLEVALLGTDIRPGVYAMVNDMREALIELRQELRAERKARADDQRWRDLVAYGSAGATVICALMILVLLLK